MNDKEKGKVIFNRDLEIHNCGYYSVCMYSHKCPCDLEVSTQEFQFEVWENMRAQIEKKFENFWKD